MYSHRLLYAPRTIRRCVKLKQTKWSEGQQQLWRLTYNSNKIDTVRNALTHTHISYVYHLMKMMQEHLHALVSGCTMNGRRGARCTHVASLHMHMNMYQVKYSLNT